MKKGEKAIVVKVYGHGLFHKRLLEMGFINGKTIEVIRFAPFGDPVVYKILGSEIAVRLDTASMIKVRLLSHNASKLF